MKTVIFLNPVRIEDSEQLTVDVEGLSVWVNGEEFDFSPMRIGDILPPDAIDHELFFGPVLRTDEGIELTLTFPLGINAPKESRFPEPVVVTEDGPVDIPVFEGDQPEPLIEMPSLEGFSVENRLQQDSDPEGRESERVAEILRFATGEQAGSVPGGE